MASALDLSDLDGVDLTALRLGAQVMSHKAELAARPRVETFFKTLQWKVDEEIARRRHESDTKPLASFAALPLATADAAAQAPPSTEDRRLTAEYLDILGANDRLSPPVRQAFRTLREALGPDY
jgi:hypothetical protein